MARILVTNFHPSGGGGHVPYIQALTELPENSEHVIGVAAPEGSRIYRYLSERSYPYLYCCDFPAKIQKELPGILRSIRKFREIVSDFRPDVVHANGGADLFIVTWSHPLSRHFKIVRTHHAIRRIPKNYYHRWLYQNRVESNIYVSLSALRLSTVSGLSLSNSTVIENGVNLSHFRPVPRNAALAARYRIDDHTFCFGSCAGTGAYKRIDTIIEAAAQLKGGGKFKILVLGNKSSGKALQKMADEKGVDEFIYCGFHDDVLPFVSLFDVGFILSDSTETISFAAREMMAMGKPLISSSFSGLKENVQDGINGFIVEPGNSHDIALAMERFLEMNKETLNSFSARAREYAVDNFNIAKQKNSHSLLYERISRRSNGSS